MRVRRWYDQVNKVVRPWGAKARSGRVRAIRNGSGEQAQMDWGHFGNWDGKRLYGFALTQAESHAKHTRNVRLKTQWAHFPYNKGLDQFDFDFQPLIDERKLLELARLAFLERKENVLLLGPPGVGKADLAIALGTEAIVVGSSIYFVTMKDFVGQFQRARDENKLKER